LLSWIGQRDDVLRVFMTVEGRSSHSDVCTACGDTEERGKAEYICEDCFSRRLVCRACCIHNHIERPLDSIKKWNGKFFEDTSLRELGLRVQLGHPDGSFCPFPEPGPTDFTLIHTSKLHCVNVAYCGCPVSMAKAHWEQLMLNEWLPATMERPRTACTFRALELFHMLSHRGKITAY
ncbi:hypothetical protein BT96DRAFT_778291, partial [Gymnopus androsaceus JB14]